MRIIAFTDIHSNYLALKEVLSKIEKEQPDQIIFLGDILAKGSEPKECFDLLIEKKVTCLAGNCDLYFVRGVDIDELIKDNSYDLMVLGHSHQEFVKENVISLGSSGLDRPSYVVIDIGESIKYKIVS